MKNSQELLDSLSQAPDRNKFQQLYQQTNVRLFGVCMRILNDQQLAEDCLQESYVKVWQHAKSYDSNKSQANTWLSRIVRNQAIDMLRGNSRMDTTNEIPEVIDTSPSVVESMETIQTNAKLQGCLQALKPEQIHCLMSSYFKGQTAKQIAAQMGRPESTVKTWMSRSMPVLRDCMEKHHAQF